MGPFGVLWAVIPFELALSVVQHEGLKVTDVVVLIDREQGGAARMASNGLRLHSAFTLSFIIGVLLRHGLVTKQVAADVKAFIAGNQTFDASAPKIAPAPSKPKRYSRPTQDHLRCAARRE